MDPYVHRLPVHPLGELEDKAESLRKRLAEARLQLHELEEAHSWLMDRIDAANVGILASFEEAWTQTIVSPELWVFAAQLLDISEYEINEAWCRADYSDEAYDQINQEIVADLLQFAGPAGRLVAQMRAVDYISWMFITLDLGSLVLR